MERKLLRSLLPNPWGIEILNPTQHNDVTRMAAQQKVIHNS